MSEPVMTGSLLGVEHNFRDVSPYRASADIECSPVFSKDGLLLRLSGLVLDVISQTGETQPMELGDNDAFHPIQTIQDAFEERKRYISWRSVAGLLTRKRCVTGEDLEDAYWHSLIAGYNRGPGQLADKVRIKAQYNAWKRHSFKHAYLRYLPSPVIEWALAVTICMTTLKILVRFLICLPIISQPHEFKHIMVNAANQRMVRTQRGYIGLASDAARIGDSIIVYKGGKLSLLVREFKGDRRLRLVGGCYIHGIMNSEAFGEVECKPLLVC